MYSENQPGFGVDGAQSGKEGSAGHRFFLV